MRICVVMLLTAWLWASEAPAISQPRLLFAGAVGGVGDQWFADVRIGKGSAEAANQEGLRARIRWDEADRITSATVSGDPSTASDVPSQLPTSGTTDGMSWGYNQVHPDLQLPYLNGPGWKLWGWTLQDAQTSKVRYAPAMADSRIRLVQRGPGKSYVVFGTTDGGNTILRGDPRDHNITLEPAIGNAITGGGGGGASTWIYRISDRGVPLSTMVVRGFAKSFTCDQWGRTVVVGGGIIRAKSATVFGADDGGGILIADAAWNTALFTAHLGGKGVDCDLWSAKVDSKQGLLAVAGWTRGTYPQVNCDWKQGKDRNAFLAVIRLWDAPKQVEASSQPRP